MKAATLSKVVMRLLQNTGRLSALFILLIIGGCGSEKQVDQSECMFYEPGDVYEKWDTFEDHHSARLRGNPQEITDSVFYNLGDTTFSATGAFGYHKVLQFDKEGHRILRRLFLGTKKIYEENGTDCIHKKFLTYNKFPDDINQEQSFESILTRKNDSVYNIQYMRPDSMHSIVTFLRSENTIHEQTWIDDTVYNTVVSYYKDGLLDRRQTIYATNNDTLDHRYYYDSKGNLDSSVYTGTVWGKDVYTKNEQGDVVVLSRTEYDNQFPDIRFRYEYDTKGNWIKRIGYIYTGDDSLKKVQRYPYYSLVKRSIKY